MDDIPDRAPYLRADLRKSAAWAARLASVPGLRVGLCWAGGHRPHVEAQKLDRRRSMSLSMLEPLGAVQNVSFFSLQKGRPASDEARAPPAGLSLIDWTDELPDFSDTAALVANLDLVVTVDTAVAHLAGALGCRVWMLNRFDTDWRWLHHGHASRWYPTLRIFRQPSPGDWLPPISDVCRQLALLAGTARDRDASPS
jgi:hypothetical protein